MMAIRVARAFTGRPFVAKAEGGYHGTWDDVQLSVSPPLDQAGAVERPTASRTRPASTPGAERSTVLIPYNDLESARAPSSSRWASDWPPSSSSPCWDRAG